MIRALNIQRIKKENGIKISDLVHKLKYYKNDSIKA